VFFWEENHIKKEKAFWEINFQENAYPFSG